MDWVVGRARLLASIWLAIFLNGHVYTAQAHGVVVWAEVVQDRVQVEVFLSDGQRLRQGRVQVLDRDGIQLLEGKLNEQGLFVFPLPQQDELLIKVSQGEGHRGEFSLKLE